MDGVNIDIDILTSPHANGALRLVVSIHIRPHLHEEISEPMIEGELNILETLLLFRRVFGHTEPFGRHPEGGICDRIVKTPYRYTVGVEQSLGKSTKVGGDYLGRNRRTVLYS